MNVLYFPDWDSRQHYKTRAAPWVKLYTRDVDPRHPTSATYLSLDAATRGVLADLQRLAVEYQNAIPHDAAWLAMRLRLNEIDVQTAVTALLDASICASICASKSASTPLPLPLVVSAVKSRRDRERDASKFASKTASIPASEAPGSDRRRKETQGMASIQEVLRKTGRVPL